MDIVDLFIQHFKEFERVNRRRPVECFVHVETGDLLQHHIRSVDFNYRIVKKTFTFWGVTVYRCIDLPKDQFRFV